MTLRIGMIAEGPTDAMVVEQLLGIFLNKAFTLQVLQPDLSMTDGLGSYGPSGTGWKGVKRWCEKIKENPGFQNFVTSTPPYDLFIVQLDADVARESEISCAQPCPPAQDTVEALKQIILGWLGEGSVKPPTVLMVPADNLEAWLLAYLTDDEKYEPIECVIKPDQVIARKPFKIKKSIRSYRVDVLPYLQDNWEKIKLKCEQARKFEEDVLRIL